ncbi:hypothetical protein [Marinifilum caeruleilacunae]|uniref:Uncharacterized protein n=1 Tax=Marinifilum caeruleilacunae TaxID=2499076 RepID=A0ABX1WR02_9BACT|nr:hypothetical protein [Marinifilum caeruleilacunae]NOU58511.1 hypothetical protein [Marinifilum caeruleilacunae]
MKLFQNKESFSIQSQLQFDELIEKLSTFVDFKHKGKISTFQIREDYYGTIENEGSVKLYKTPFISGLLDKGLSTSIYLTCKKDEIEVSIVDHGLYFILFIFVIIAFSAGIIFYFAILYPEARKLLWLGFSLIAVPLTAFVLDRTVFFSTLKDIKKRLKMLE